MNITNFINSSLAPHETYFDFSNAPLLYIFTNKKFTQYLIPNIFHSSEIIQNDAIRKFDTIYQQEKVPLVLFKQGNRWDNVDFTPNEIRSYRIAEYIYTHYRPVGYIDNKYQLWIATYIDNRSVNYYETQKGFAPVSKITQNFTLQKLPYIWGTYDPYCAVTDTKVLKSLVANNTIVLEKKKELNFSVDTDIDKSSGNYVYMRLKSSRSANTTLKYGGDGLDIFTFVTIPTSKPEHYLIRVSTQWNWMHNPVDKISLISDENIELYEMNIRKGD